MELVGTYRKTKCCQSNSGIYAIVCSLNRFCYVGASKNLDKRRIQHLSRLRSRKSHNENLQLDFNKFGEKAFFFEVLEECKKSEFRLHERKWTSCFLSYGLSYNKNC